MNSKRSTGIELARVISMLMVLVIHTLVETEDISFSRVVLDTFLWTCNFMFLMISGELNLMKRMDSPAEMLQFYLRRMVTVFLPLVLTTAMMYGVDVFNGEKRLSLGNLYASVMGSYSSTHLWFVYGLTGLLLSTPILSKSFQHMTNGELHVIFGAAVFWVAVEYYFSEALGIYFSFKNWLLDGIVIYFFLGYYLRRVLTPRLKKYLYAAGILCFFATIILQWYFYDYFAGLYEDAPTYILFVMALYVFLTRDIPVKGWLEKAVLFLGRHSFTIYLIHWTTLFYVVPLVVPDLENPVLFFFCRYIANLILCVPFAAVFDHFLLFPLQKKLTRLISSL